MKDFNPETFVTDIFINLDHSNFFALFSDICELTADFNIFIEIIKTTVHDHAPVMSNAYNTRS